MVAALGVLYLFCFDHKVRYHTMRRKLTWLILGYLGLLVVASLWALQQHTVTLKAAALGVVLDGRFLAFFLLCWAIAIRTPRFEKRWPKLLLWPAVIVVVFGLLQVFILPPDFLRHFGYGAATIPPMETINHNTHYLRYMSTLRGANPLGAYLLLPISALVVLLVKYPRSWNWTKGLLLVGALAMLFFSFSRSAWIGAVLSILTAIGIAYRPTHWRHFKPVLAAGLAALILVAVGLTLALDRNASFQNILLHTQDNSAVKTTSNGDHAAALTRGINDLGQQPLGRGPGTAGPASQYNNHQLRIAEDYYLQIGQELGWPGVILFIAIVAGVAYLLWMRRHTTLALTLLAALVGISFVNLLSHAWTDDTLAYLWWGLAGLAIGTPVEKHED